MLIDLARWSEFAASNSRLRCARCRGAQVGKAPTALSDNVPQGSRCGGTLIVATLHFHADTASCRWRLLLLSRSRSAVGRIGCGGLPFQLGIDLCSEQNGQHRQVAPEQENRNASQRSQQRIEVAI